MLTRNRRPKLQIITNPKFIDSILVSSTHSKSKISYFNLINKNFSTKMAMNNGLRSCASKFLSSTQSFLPKSVNRGIHSTGVKKMGGGHGHDEPFYLHAKHMYNLDRMKHQQLKMTLGVLSAFTIGVAVPVYAVIFQQKKTSSA